MEPKYVTFENTFMEGPQELGPGVPALACTAIDGYPADPDAEGTVICNVWLLKDHQFLVDWHHNGYRMNQAVLECIENAKAQMLEAFDESSEDAEDTLWLAVDQPSPNELEAILAPEKAPVVMATNCNMYSVVAFIAGVSLGAFNSKTGFAYLCLDGRRTESTIDISTCAVGIGDQPMLMSLWRLHQIFGSRVKVLWVWHVSEDHPAYATADAIEDTTEALEERDWPWFAQYTQWPADCYVPLEKDGDVEKAIMSGVTLRDLNDYEKDSLMDYDKFMDYAEAVCVDDHDGAGCLVLDGKRVQDSSVMPTQELVTLPGKWIAPMPVLRDVFGKRLGIVWYNK